MKYIKVFSYCLVTLFIVLLVACNKDDEKTFTVKFYLEDELYLSESVKDGKKVEKPEEPTKEGFVFDGWYKSDGSLFDFDEVVKEDLELNGQFSAQIYNVKLIIDNEVQKYIAYYVGQEIGDLSNYKPKKDGYSFLGWYYNDELISSDHIVESEMELIAKFEIIKYNVILKSDDSIIGEIKINSGTQIGDLSNYKPEKEGYEFKGWLYNDELIDETFVPQADVVLQAKWEPQFEEEYIDLEFVIDGKPYKTMSFEAGDVVVLLELYKAEKYGYEFVGWYFGDTKIENGYMPLKSGTVEARFEPLGTIYKLTIDGEEREFLEGDEYALPNKIKKDHTLIGYADENNYVIQGTILMNKNYNLTSVWVSTGNASNSYQLELKEKETLTVAYGDSVILPFMNKFGYAFMGWTDGKYNYKNGFSMKVVNNYSLTPIYKQYDPEDNYSNVAYTMSNLMLFYDSLQFPLKFNVELPVFDESTKTSIKWTSNNASVLTDDGKVTRIYHEERNIPVKMTAVVSYEDITESIDFTFTVKQSYKSLKDGIAAGYLYPANGISDFGLDTLDIVYGAFLYFDASGNITGQDSYINSMSNFMSRAHARGVRVVASIGAQGSSTINYMKTISESQTLINKFADNLLEYVIKAKLDGIDMDWETPGTSHAANYPKLMKAIYEKFKAYDNELLVTAAIGAGPWQYKYFDLKNSAKYHDYINMMSYDLQSSSKSSYQNALYASSKNYLLTNECNIDGTLKLYNSVGIPNNKVIIGVPFYGRTFTNSTGPGSNSTHSGAITQGVIHDYKLKYGASIEHWDDECKVPYIYIPELQLFITYENPLSISEKMKYIGEKGLAGIMYWQNGQDYNELLMNAINANYKYMKK